MARRGAPIAGALALATAIGGCSNLLSDDCSVSKQVAAPGGGRACSNARAERTVLFSGDDFPRLWTGEAARTQANVNAAILDKAPPSGAGGQGAVAYFGSTRVDYPDDAQGRLTDISQMRDAGAKNLDPDQLVNVNFNHATLDFFLKQLLGGALGVNYVAPDNLGGSVTLRTQEPLPKSQVLQVVRDVLGRNGLGMVYLNGVYQIASGDALKEIQAADQIGADKATRIVPVRRGSAEAVVGLARQLVPADVSMTPTNSNDAILVRAGAANLDAAVDVVSSLIRDGVGSDKMAIIPVRQASPELIATQLQAYYAGRLGKGEDLTIIPLTTQQALLVGSRDARLMGGLRTLVEQLDRRTQPEAALRIVQLTYLSAADVAPQLSAIFGGSSVAPTPARGAAGPRASSSRGGGGSSPYGGLSQGGGGGGLNGSGPSGSGPLPSSSSASSPSVSSLGPQGGLDPAGSASVPGALSSATTQSSPIGFDPGSQAGAGATQAGGPGATDDGAVRFVPDTRNNAIMIYSSYQTYQRVRDVLKAIDQPQAQVVIEATIADVTLNDDLKYGVQWFLSGHGFTVRSSQQGGALSDPGTAGGVASIGASIGGVSASVLLTALQSITNVKVISSPYLTVVDGKEARLVIGNQIPYTTTTQTSTSNATGNSTITNATTTLETGVILDVTPRILSNNSVELSIDQEVTQPDSSVSNGNTQPVIQTRSVKSDVQAQSGRTVVLGGMIQETSNRTESGTPVAQALPLVGNLFKTKADTGGRTELLVLLTPRVVRQSAQLENISRLLRDQLHVN